MSDKANDLLFAGQELESRGDLPRALVCYEKALKMSDRDARLWIAKGVCLMKLRHWNDAIKALRTGINLQPAYAEADARVFLANALLSAGRKKEAREQYLYVSTMEPCYPSYDGPIDEANAALKKLG